MTLTGQCYGEGDVFTYGIVDEMNNLLKEYFDRSDAEYFLNVLSGYDSINPLQIVEFCNGHLLEN